jgi:UTP--glucose-1-phosphate uridylyltransferase
VGGLGTRFLPATSNAKEMLPVVDKPLIQYAVEEALPGIEELIFVTGRENRPLKIILLFFRIRRDTENGVKVDYMTLGVPKLAGNIAYTRQEPLGLGHAVWCARHLIGNEPFAVLLADDFIHSEKPCLQQMIQSMSSTAASWLLS